MFDYEFAFMIKIEVIEHTHFTGYEDDGEVPSNTTLVHPSYFDPATRSDGC